MTALLTDLPHREESRFVLLPSAKPLSHSDAVGLVNVPIPLTAGREHGARRVVTFQSAPIHIPAGEYFLEGGSEASLRLCNGQGCIATTTVGSGYGFTTRIALGRFYVRAERPDIGLRLRCRHLWPPAAMAERSLGLSSGLRVHSLDDHAYLDPKGFWVHAGLKARFVIEGDCGNSCSVGLANGGKDNWVEVAHQAGEYRFWLRSWEKRRVSIPMEGGISLLAIRSATGFRPSDFISGSQDDRLLGVFLISPPNSNK
jgi:hypothetical protein